MGVVRSAPQEAHCHADLIHLLIINVNDEKDSELIVLRVIPIPNRFPTNVLYTPVDSTLLHSIPSV